MIVPQFLGEIVAGVDQFLLDDVEVSLHESSDVAVRKVLLVVQQGR